MSFTPPSTFTGTAHSMTYSKPVNTPVFSITGMSIQLQTLAGLVMGGDENTILAAIFAGADQISGSTLADILKGYDGNDTLKGGARRRQSRRRQRLGLRQLPGLAGRGHGRPAEPHHLGRRRPGRRTDQHREPVRLQQRRHPRR